MAQDGRYPSRVGVSPLYREKSPSSRKILLNDAMQIYGMSWNVIASLFTESSSVGGGIRRQPRCILVRLALYFGFDYVQWTRKDCRRKSSNTSGYGALCNIACTSSFSNKLGMKACKCMFECQF